MKTDAPFFDYIAQRSDLASSFASYMQSVQSSYGTSLNHLLTGYDWANLGEALVVDVRDRHFYVGSNAKYVNDNYRLVDPPAALASHSRKLFPS